MTVEWIVAGLAGALVGVLVGLVFYWRRASAMAQALARLQDAQARNSALEASEGNLRVQLQDALEQASEQQRRASSLAADNARLEERLSGTTEKLQWLEQSREQMKKEFEQLSSRIFEERSQRLQEQNRTGLDDLLRPFRQQLTDFRRRVDEIHTEESKTSASLTQQLQQLQQLNHQMVEDARNLTNALKGQTKTQGNWGEMILERILEESGLTRGREYETQVSIDSAEGRRQPDVIVHLPDGKDVIIDAKVSLTAYERYCREDGDEADRQRALDEHLVSLRNHVKELSDKGYETLEGVQTLDFVLLFVPVEGAFLTAMEKAPGLYTEAYNRHIVLVSPTTLLVTLRTINNIWRNEYQNRNALDIADRAGKIIDQVSLLTESFEDVGKRIRSADKAWEKSYKQLASGRGNLLRQAHQLQDMGARARRQLPSLDAAEDADAAVPPLEGKPQDSDVPGDEGA